jgi:hypothetical protein
MVPTEWDHTMGEAQPDLALLMRQQARMLDEFGDFRDQLTVLTAIAMRVEGAVTALTIEVRAIHARHARLARRVEVLEQPEPA